MSSFFGKRCSPFEEEGMEFHPGIDYATIGKIPILASREGTVTYAGRKGGYGNLVVLTHEMPDGTKVQTYYGHMSKISVSKNQTVTNHQVLGITGTTGRSNGIHLHFEVRVFDKNSNAWVLINPLLVI